MGSAFCDHGPSLYESATLFADGRTVFVIARGQGYVVDGYSGQLLQLFALSADGRRWRSERIETDGVVLDTAPSSQVQGKLWMAYGPEGWYGFTLDLTAWRVERGAWLTDDFHRFVPRARCGP